MDDERAKRISQNEALFREVNERVRALTTEFQATDEPMQIMCECGNPDCEDRLKITVPAYEEIRADPARFVTAQGHQIESVERVVDDRGDYIVVEKDPGLPAEVAERLDPRSSG